MQRRVRVLAALVVAVCAAAPGVGPNVPGAQAKRGLPAKPFTRPIEAYADYDGQHLCTPTAKPGVVAFQRMVLAAFPGTGSDGITRGCRVGGRSEHKEGRAWDWEVNARSATDRARVAALMKWLFATDQYGNQYAMARRLGIMYIIWDRKIWGIYAADQGWRCYYRCAGEPGSWNNDAHTGHVHFSFTWAGARRQTTFFGYQLSPTLVHFGDGGSGDFDVVTTGAVPLGVDGLPRRPIQPVGLPGD